MKKGNISSEIFHTDHMELYQEKFALIIPFCSFIAFFQRKIFFFDLFSNLYFKRQKVY